MNYLKRLISVVALLALGACGGGGGDSGTPLTGTGSNSGSVTDIVLVLSANSVTNKGTDTVTATATALDSNRNAVADVPLTISVDANAVATTTTTKTDTAGKLTATIGIGADRTNRTITVSAKTGNIARTATLTVVDAAATNSASDLVLVLGATTIANTGTRTVSATVTALDAKRNALSDVAVNLTADNGAVVTAASKVTGTAGTITATIGIGSDRTNRDIIVTAQTGTIVKSTVLKVVTDPGTTTPVAADLALVLSAPSVTNGGSNTITATATAVDLNRNVVAGIPITFAVDSGATAAVSGTVTDAKGQVTATIGIGADRSNRTIGVTASAVGVTPRTANFVVTGSKLSSASAPLVIAGSANNQIEYTLVDFNAIPMVGQTVTVTGNGLTKGEGKTDLNGKYIYVYQAPNSQTTLTIKADSSGVSREDSVLVSTGTGAIPVADSAALSTASASVTPTPSVVTVNAPGSKTNQVEVRALFVGAGNKPIPNVRVRFDLAGNSTNSDGVIEWVGSYAYSDANGIARATFIPGQRSSPTNGITVRACFAANDFSGGNGSTANGCDGTSTQSTTATLTVSSEALSVNIRTNALIKEGPAQLTFIKEYVVMVVDSSGLAKADVQITPSVDLTAFYKGFFSWNGVIYVRTGTLGSDQYWQWSGTAWGQTSPPDALTAPLCPNEDVNRNGIRDAGVFDPLGAAPAVATRQEDLNWNGELDPRKADVAVKMVGSSKTDANGLAIVQIEYGKNLATWVDYIITVTASGVSGTEARARYPGNLPFPAADIRTESAPPAFRVSPYGVSSVCTDAK